MRPRRALFIAHEADVAPGYIGDAAAARGFTVERFDVWTADLPDPTGYDLIVPLGSAEAAYDDAVPWLDGELAFLRRAVDHDVAVFGICFGAQALARALGGRVCPAAPPEVGWFRIDSVAPDTIAPGPWLEWHFDALTPPAGATTLARSAAGVQAYHRGRTLGVQFHPEVSPEILAEWIAGSRDRLAEIGVDAEAFQRETRRRVPQARRAAAVLFDRVLARLDL
ncbi:MAG TPA: type 1 glutamine amidotransferase [Euzebyales bacterium]|nr:type 1 glutamine amidotransferase [Euzebyales bacterium]